MENGYFYIFVLLFLFTFQTNSIRDVNCNCPVSTGTIVSDHLRVAVDGDIIITNQDSYCYDYTLYKHFSSRPNVAVAINKFIASQSKNLYLNIKPIPSTNSKNGSGANFDSSLTTISFSVILYQPYTKWTLIQFYFLAQNKVQIQAGYFLVDGSQLSKCDSGKTIDVYMPFARQLSGNLQAYTFLNGFQISSKTSSGSNIDKYSPLEVQIINKVVTISGISVTLSVTSNTQIYSVSISYLAFQPKYNKIYGNQYLYQNYEQYPTQNQKTVVHAPQVYVESMWAKIYGISGFIINSNTQNLKFDGGDFANTSIFSIKINNYWKYFSYEYVFFLGGICSDCEGYNIYYLGDCLKQCPPSFIFNGYTCIKCAQSQVWNGTHCINRCNSGKIWINGNCMCPNNFQWNGFNCAPCTNGKIWQSVNRICVCPNNMIWNGYNCIVCQGGKILDPYTKTCICPSGYTWTGFTCTIVCPNDQIWNSTTNQCQCIQGFLWNGTNCVQCTNGRLWNSFTRQCQCQNGFWNGYVCGTSCPNGMIWNSISKVCECPKRTYNYNGDCIACGSVNGDISRRECQCTGTSTYFNGFTCITCDKNRIWNQKLTTCDCPQFTKWNGTDCVSLCNKGYQQIGKSCFCPLNTYQSNGQCLTYNNCLTGTLWNNNLKKCDPILCDAGTFWNGQTCYSDNQNGDCPFGTYWNDFYCSSYSDSCPQGTQWNGDYCLTVDKKCQAGNYWTGSACSIIPSECPPQLTWSDPQNRCIPSSNICPTGTYYNGYSCMPYSSCKNGQVWSNALVQCICPQSSFWNGATCIVCKNGMSYGNSGCFCPLGTFLDGNKCSKIESKNCNSVPNSQLIGQNCQCLPGFDKIQLSCVCNGVLIGKQCNKCTKKPNSNWDGYSCKCNKNYVDINGKCKLIKQTTNPNPQINSNKSPCSVGTYFQKYQQKCLLCSDGCLACKNCNDCSQCRPQYTYYLPSKSCLQICGDGKRFSLQCDDGNNLDGDGCSSDCKIQPEYTCNGGSPNSKDQCSKYKPQIVDMHLTGQTHLFGKIILNVMLNYLPTNLTLSDQCKQSCDKILLVKLIEGQKTFLSINSQYIKTTSFSFSIQIDFGRQPISTFVAQVSINDKIKDKYFKGIDTSKTIRVQVNPALLALVTSRKQDTLT